MKIYDYDLDWYEAQIALDKAHEARLIGEFVESLSDIN